MTEVANKPNIFTKVIQLNNGEKVIFRTLLSTDPNKLAFFLKGLSKGTRILSKFDGYDFNTAKELCNAINKYDKLRFVIENESNKIVGLIELSFGFPESDLRRYSQQGYIINPETTLRFGPTIADDYQNIGLGSKMFPHIVEIVKQFGKQNIILWGGVLEDNKRAIHYYEKQGFSIVGTFTNNHIKHLDMMLNINDYSH
jgi:ribosomal protein S18 acetylase RimI-like enzyme